MLGLARLLQLIATPAAAASFVSTGGCTLHHGRSGRLRGACHVPSGLSNRRAMPAPTGVLARVIGNRSALVG